jgi:predicted nucleic acid-binding Zn ribbon protein
VPIFVWRCGDCREETEKSLPYSVAKDATVRCQGCKGILEPRDRVPTSGSFQLKGSGFHQNDYPKKGR